MYIPTGGGLGKDIEKSGHIRKAWSHCQAEGARQRRCDIEFRVKFRSSFEGFSREMERALARWMTLPRARSLIKKLEARLKKWHQEISDLNYPANAPMHILGALVYRGPSGTWRVVDVVLQTYMLFSSAQLKAGAK